MKSLRICGFFLISFLLTCHFAFSQSIFKSEFDFNGFTSKIYNIHSYNNGHIIINGTAAAYSLNGNKTNSFSLTIDSLGNICNNNVFYFDSVSFKINNSVFDEFGNVYSVGEVYDSITNNRDQFVLKSDTSGFISWFKAFRFSSNGIGNALGGISLNNDVLIVTGSINHWNLDSGGVVLIKIDTAGVLIDLKYLKSNHQFSAYDIISISDSSYLIAGNMLIDSFPTFDPTTCFFIMKLDNNLNPVWQKAFLTNDTNVDLVRDLQKINDNLFLVSGQLSFNGDINGYLLKIDSLGNQLDCKLYCSNLNLNEIWNITKRNDNSIVLSGLGIPNYCHIDSNGIILSAKNIGINPNVIFSIANASDNGLVIGQGTFGNSSLVYKSDSLLNFSCQQTIFNNCQTTSIVLDSFAFNVIDTSFTYSISDVLNSSGLLPDYNVVCLTHTAIKDVIKNDLISVFPNPAIKGNEITFTCNFIENEPGKLEIFDFRGQLVMSMNINPWSSFTKLKVDFNSGSYLSRISYKEKYVTTKFFIIE